MGYYAFGEFRLDTGTRSLRRGSVGVPLSARGFDMLQLLVEARDRVVSRDELIAKVWPGLAVEASNLTVQMSALRKALGDTGEEPGLIATVAGRGYRFIGALQGDGASAPADAAQAQAQARGAEQRPRWRKALAPALLLGLSAAALGGFVLRWEWKPRAPAPAKLSIVVMPFRNLSDGPGKDYLADAISDDLTTDLSHIPGSLVIARESADSYKGRPATAQQIGRELNVHYLLQGSLRAEGELARVNAQLIDTVTGAQLWAERFDAREAHAMDAQTDIVHRIASGLSVALVSAEVSRAGRERPRNADAVDLFYQARSIIDRAGTLADMNAAQALLEQAVAKQPDFVDALASLGWLLVRKEQGFEYPGWEADDAEANRVIGRALALAPDNPAVLAASGRLLVANGKWDEATAALDAALNADPGNVQALTGKALCAWQRGDPAAVSAPLQAALRIDPLGPAIAARLRLLGLATLFAGDARAALPTLLRAEAQSGPIPADTTRPSPPEEVRAFLVAATALAGDAKAAKRRAASYSEIWPRISVWRQAALLNAAQAGVPGFARIEDAMANAGIPRFADEGADAGIVPTAVPLDGGEFAPTPLSVPGASTVDTAALQRLLAAATPPLVLDVGKGVAVPRGALWMPDFVAEDGGGRKAAEQMQAVLRRATGGLVVMDTGSSGSDGYNAALRLVARAPLRVLWYRGGEEAWARAGLPADDRRQAP